MSEKELKELASEYALFKGGGAEGHQDFRRLRRLEQIRGRSFKVCQKHYDKRRHRGLMTTDEIVSRSECALCNKPLTKTKEALEE